MISRQVKHEGVIMTLANGSYFVFTCHFPGFYVKSLSISDEILQVSSRSMHFDFQPEGSFAVSGAQSRRETSLLIDESTKIVTPP